MRRLDSPRISMPTAAAIGLLASLALAGGLHAQGTVEDVAGQLICLCGCNKMLNVCDMQTAQEMKDIIATKLDEGLDKSEIVDYMTNTYGEQVLAAPTKRGFNLTAWLAPFALLGAGAGFLWLLVHLWVRRRRESPLAAARHGSTPMLESRFGELLDRELNVFED